MPRGDGKPAKRPRVFKARYNLPQYTPGRLKRRLYDYDESKRSTDEERMSCRPGSQNPRKS